MSGDGQIYIEEMVNYISRRWSNIYIGRWSNIYRDMVKYISGGGQIYKGSLLPKVFGLEGEEELLTIVPATVRSPFTGS